jgi:competence protein ComEA
VDRATAEELESLPRIGPALARRIIADRDSLGPFGSLDALQRVKGIGPGVAKQLAPRVTFSGVPRGG